MTDSKPEEILGGQADDRLNGMTTDQFRDLVGGVEKVLYQVCGDNMGMVATLLVELQCRMVLDADETEPELGDKMLASFHAGIDETIASFRRWAAEAAHKRNQGMN